MEAVQHVVSRNQPSMLDAHQLDTDTMRNVEAGPDGIEYLAFGAGEDPRDAEMAPNWWSD